MRMSETDDQLKRRRPTRLTSLVLGDNRAIGRFVNPQSLSREPHSLGWDEKPFETTGVLIRVAELPEYKRCAGIHHPLLRNEKITRRELAAVVECGIERKRTVSFELVEPAKVVLPIERQPFVFDAAVDCQHLIGRFLQRYTRRKRSGREGKHAVGIVDRCVIRIAC